jgi:hypothetical protein
VELVRVPRHAPYHGQLHAPRLHQAAGCLPLIQSMRDPLIVEDFTETGHNASEQNESGF